MGLFNKKKWYMVTWAYEINMMPSTDVVKARSKGEACSKVMKKHALPIYIKNVEEFEC